MMICVNEIKVFNKKFNTYANTSGLRCMNPSLVKWNILVILGKEKVIEVIKSRQNKEEKKKKKITYKENPSIFFMTE